MVLGVADLAKCDAYEQVCAYLQLTHLCGHVHTQCSLAAAAEQCAVSERHSLLHSLIQCLPNCFEGDAACVLSSSQSCNCHHQHCFERRLLAPL
jgi:hypothetical protein